MRLICKALNRFYNFIACFIRQFFCVICLLLINIENKLIHKSYISYYKERE